MERLPRAAGKELRHPRARIERRVLMERLPRGRRAVLLVLGLVAGCVEGFDSFNGSDEAYYRLFDYVIDRPRVLAVTWWPPGVSGGRTVTFRALAATPEDPISPKVSWWACGLSLDTPFVYYGADCMQTSLAEFLGTGASLTVRLPDYDVSACEQTGSCYGYIPVIAVVASQDGTETGQGITFLTPDYYDRAPEPSLDAETWNATLELRIDGSPEGTATAAPGDAVQLEAVLPAGGPSYLFSWYVTEGTLVDHGVTSPADVTPVAGGGLYRVIGTNTLVMPEAPSGAIQVYVVATPTEVVQAPLVRFATRTIEVQR